MQRLRRLVQTETDRSVDLNALSSQARDGDHYNNVIVSIAAESGETPNFQRFCDSVAQRFFSLAPGNSSLRVCDRLCGADFSLPKIVFANVAPLLCRVPRARPASIRIWNRGRSSLFGVFSRHLLTRRPSAFANACAYTTFAEAAAHQERYDVTCLRQTTARQASRHDAKPMTSFWSTRERIRLRFGHSHYASGTAETQPV